MTSITSLPSASLPLTGSERVPMDQTIGSPIAATALVVGTGYRIETVGNTNWTACGLPAGVTAAAGLTFVATAAGTGTGTAIEARTVEATAQAIADLAGATAGTDLAYNPATRQLSSSTGTDATLPLATDILPGLMAAGDKARIEQLGADDSPTFAGMTITGTAAVSIPHIHGDLAGAVYIHVKNTTAGTLIKGSPVYSTRTVGDTTTLEVAGADSSNASLLPAVGLLANTLAPNDSGHAVIAGELTALNTAGFTIGDALYVAAGGGLTATRPTTGTIQQVAIVGRVNANSGSITVTISTELSPNWDTAYSQRLQWDGGATGLNAATGRTSLGLGTLATQSGTFSGASSGANTGDVTLAASVADVLSLSGQELQADDPGGDRLLFWDDSEGRLRHLSLGAGLSITGTTIDAAGGGLSDGDKGDITVSGGNWTIDAGAVSYSKIQNVSATDRILGRSSAGAGLVEEIICTAAARALLDDANDAAQRQTIGAEQAGAAAAAVSAHVAAADPHPAYALESNLGTAAGAASSDFVSATAARAANLALAGPVSGAAAAPTFRALVAADLPATAVVAGAYGSGSSVPTFTVDAQGRLTAANNVTISLAAAAISDSTSTGRAVMTAADAAAARNAISAEQAGAAAAAQAAAVQRGNHTGTQLASTISDFASAVAALGTTVGNALRSLVNPSAVAFLRINADNTVATRSASEMRTDLGLAIGTSAGNLVALDGSARLPAVDGSQLTNLPGVSNPDVLRVGFYFPTSNAAVQTGQAVAQNTIWFYPFRVLRPIRITGSQIRVVTALTGGQFQVAIYASNGRVPTGNPLTTSGDQSFGAVTLVTGPMTSAWLYPNQVYFRALNVTGGSTGTFIAPNFSVPEFSSLIGVATSSASASALNHELSLAWTYGTWPDMTTRTASEASFTRAMFHLLVSELG